MDQPTGEESAGSHAPGGRYGAVLAIPSFRSLWSANMLSTLGEAFSSVALPLLAYQITGSAQLASQVFVARLIPTIVLAPASGVLVDRMDRRKLMIAADVIRALLVILIPFAAFAWQIALVAFCVSIADAVARPASLASVPLSVPPAQLVNALSANQVGGSVIRIIGPAVGAALIGLAGPKPAFFVQAACFLFGALALLPLHLPRRPGDEVASTVGQQMWEGLRTVLGNPVVRGTALVEALWQINTAVLAVTLVALLDTTLGFGNRAGEVYGALMATLSLGAAAGAIAAGRVEARIGRPVLLAVGYFSPLLFIPFAMTPPTWVLFVLGFLLFFGDAWAVIAMQAYIAESVPDRLRGRVYSAWAAVVTAGATAAFLAVGWLTTHLGPPRTIALAGVVVGLGGPLLLFASGAIDAMRRHRPHQENMPAEAGAK